MDQDWPSGADGDVFRRLETHDFDFKPSHTIDFNVDFEQWPPAKAAIEALRAIYPELEVFEPDSSGAGYVQFQVQSRLSYELVIEIQASVSALMQPYAGVCESWGGNAGMTRKTTVEPGCWTRSETAV